MQTEGQSAGAGVNANRRSKCGPRCKCKPQVKVQGEERVAETGA
jgi:hypothetical protein